MIERFNANIGVATNRLEQAEVTVSTMVNVLQRTYELAIQARNGTNSPADLKAIGVEIKNLRDQILSLSNSLDSSGNYLFAGYRVGDKPFVEDADNVVNHTGDAGIHTVQISKNQRIATGLDGADVFLKVPYNKGVASIFKTLDSMVENLNAGSFNETYINQMNEAIEHFSLQQTIIGSQINRANLQHEVNDSRLKLMEEDISNLEDADIAKLVTDLQSKLVSRNAAQQAFVKISQDSLFNYLR